MLGKKVVGGQGGRGVPEGKKKFWERKEKDNALD